MPTCKACKEELPKGACFCGFCGFRIEPIVPIPEKRPQVIAPNAALGVDPVAEGTAETVRAEQPEDNIKTLVRQRDGRGTPPEEVVVVLPEVVVPPPVEVVVPAPVEMVVPPPESIAVDPQDNRKFHRYPLRVDVTLSSRHNFFTGDSENIGGGGLFVATKEPAPVGQRIEVTFTLPGLDLPTTVPCEVRWVRDNGTADAGMGLRFLQLDRETEAAIDAFLTHREPILRKEV